MNSRFDHSLWSDLVPRLLFDSSMSIKHQRPARNIGLQWNYLKKMAFDFGGMPQLEHVEIVYKDIGIDELCILNVSIFCNFILSL